VDKVKLVKAFSEFLEVHFGGTKSEEVKLPMEKSLQNELMQETSVVYMPNTLDSQDEWMSETTVAYMCEELHKGFLEEGTLQLNFVHSIPIPKTDVEVIEVYLTKSEMYLDDVYIPEGTCAMTVQYYNNRMWELRKQGAIGGFSVHGSCLKRKPEEGQE